MIDQKMGKGIGQWSRRWRRVACAAVTACLVAAPHADAQYTETTGIADAMVPDFVNRDVMLFVQGLMLDDGQRMIVESLFDNYQMSFADGIDKMRERFSDMRDELQSGDAREIMLLIYGPFQDWRVDKDALRAEFFSDVKVVVLNEDQLPLWPAFERRMRREKSLPHGRYSGEKTNLFHVVRRLDLDASLSVLVQPAMDEYDLELDNALQHRDTVLQQTQHEMFEAIRDENGNDSIGITRRQVTERIKVREVNDRYIEAVAELLPEAESADFRERALEEGYPRVFRRNHIAQLIAAATELDDIDEDTRIAIIELETAYLDELVVINDRLVVMVRQEEPKVEEHRAKLVAARLQGTKVERRGDTLRKEFRKRDEIGDRYARSLRALLSREQFASLPGAERWLENQNRANARAKAKRQNRKQYPKGQPRGKGVGDRGHRDTGPKSRGQGKGGP